MRPYDPESIPTYEWIHDNRPVVSIPMHLLLPTQEMVVIERVLAQHRGEPPEGPDPYPHVIFHDGEFWVHNGHTRWVVALLRGDTQMLVRIAYPQSAE